MNMDINIEFSIYICIDKIHIYTDFMIYQKAKINIAMKLNFINKYIFKILNYEFSHRVN